MLNQILKLVLVLFVLISSQDLAKAQGFYFGPKGGLVVALQNWGNFQRDPLFAYQGDIFVESLDPNGTGSLFGSLGYHVRGSAIRSRTTSAINTYSTSFRFNNLSLLVGAKRRFRSQGKTKTYYQVGVRVEYTIDTNLDEFQDSPAELTFPQEGGASRFVYGISGGAGMEFEFSEFTIPFIEFNISPDLSFQYRQDSFTSTASNPVTGLPINVPQREIRNLSFELSIGFKFLRKVVYVN